MEKVMTYTLPKQLRIATANSKQNYYLPEGTVLYFDKSMSEGFDRYHVYVNVEGADWALQPLEKEGLIAPISAYIDRQTK
jgi:hypothetical protein